jgi:putative flippase GtrA
MIGQLFRFATIGVLATLIYFICLNGFTSVLHIRPVTAAVISYFISLLVSFAGQSRLTFRSGTISSVTVLKFVANSVLGLAIHAGFVYVAVARLHINQNIGAIAATIVATTISYSLMKYWIFPEQS